MRSSLPFAALLLAAIGCGEHSTRVDVTVRGGNLDGDTQKAIRSLLVSVSGAETYSTIYDLGDQLTTGAARWVYLAGVDAGELVFTIDGRDASGGLRCSGLSTSVTLRANAAVDALVELGPPLLRGDDNGIGGDSGAAVDLGITDSGPIVVAEPDGGTPDGSLDYPTFAPAVLYPVGLEVLNGMPVAVAIGDVDVDGDNDVAFVNGGTNAGQIVIASHDIGFNYGKTIVTVPAYNDFRSIALYDIDHDNKLDVATVDFASNKFLYLPSTAGYGTNSTFTVAGATAVGLANFNGDGYADLVFVQPGQTTLLAYTGAPMSNYNPVLPQPNLMSGMSAMAIGDLDQDGDPDVIVPNVDGYLSVLLWSAGNFNTGRSMNAIGSGLTGVAIGKLDGDGYPDAIVTQSDGKVFVLINHISMGTGFGTMPSLAAGTGARSPVIGDLDGDGINDVVVANQASNTLSMFLGKGDGTFGPESAIDVVVPGKKDTPAAPNALAIGNLDGDKRMDLAIATSMGVYLFLTHY